MTYNKTVSQRELNFFQKLSELELAPEILDIQLRGQYYILKYQKYPMTLMEYYDENNSLGPFENKLLNLIDELHKHCILHGDLHGNNVVVDPKTTDIRLIDFGRSYHFDEVDNDVIKHLNDFLKPDKIFLTLDDIVKFEKIMYLRDM